VRVKVHGHMFMAHEIYHFDGFEVAREAHTAHLQQHNYQPII